MIHKAVNSIGRYRFFVISLHRQYFLVKIFISQHIRYNDPIAVFSYDENRYENNEFTITFPFFHVLTFQFLMLELRKMNWRHYIHSNNPVAAA
jgi:hypothetical protein